MQELLLRIQYDNDETAFEQFYRNQVFRLFQFAFAFVHNKELSEEIVNDVFLKLWQNRSTIDQIRDLPVYLYVAVKNTAANYLRQAKARRREDGDELAVHHFHLIPNPEQLLITQELRTKIERCIDGLPPRCKLIFKLIKDDGLTFAEVATILEISYKTVTTQLTIALKKLEDQLQPSFQQIRPNFQAGKK